MPQVLRALVVDDEKPARDLLTAVLSKESDIDVVGECSDGEAALKFLAAHQVDVLFLDIQMPGLGGLEVARQVAKNQGPRTVFVTAYSDFAVEAFEVYALDYLLKPFPLTRLHETLRRARQEWATQSAAEYRDRTQRLLTASVREPEGKYIQSFRVQTAGKLFLLPIDRIMLLEAADHYTRLWCDGASHLILRAISSLEEDLNPDQFVRIHRAKVVNVGHITAIRTGPQGPAVELKDGSRHPVSRSRQSAIPLLLAALAKSAEPPA